MRFARLSVLSILVAVPMFAACGGDDGDGGGTIDAPKVIDAAPDAPVAAAALGKPCVLAMMNADCPANAPVCVGISGVGGTYCSPLCVTNGTAVGGMNGQFASFTPMPSAAACVAAFTGTVGTPQCAAVLPNYMPSGAITNGTTYTNINMTCAIACGPSNTCSAGLTCRPIPNQPAMVCVP